MRTDDLIRDLARSAAPISSRAALSRVAVAIAAGGAIAFAAMSLTLGLRADLGAALGSFPFWIKGFYALSIAAGAGAATMHLARPEARPQSWFWLLVIPSVLLSALAASELVAAPLADWSTLILGRSAPRCVAGVFALSIPLFIGLVWTFRRWAPTRLRAAGACVGLTAGASAAAVYMLGCLEVSASFVVVWYSLAIMLSALAGALFGPILLRW